MAACHVLSPQVQKKSTKSIQPCGGRELRRGALTDGLEIQGSGCILTFCCTLCADIRTLLLKIHAGECITQQRKQGSPKHSSIFNKNPIRPPNPHCNFPPPIINCEPCLLYLIWAFQSLLHPEPRCLSFCARVRSCVFGLPSFMRADSQQC